MAEGCNKKKVPVFLGQREAANFKQQRAEIQVGSQLITKTTHRARGRCGSTSTDTLVVHRSEVVQWLKMWSFFFQAIVIDILAFFALNLK